MARSQSAGSEWTGGDVRRLAVADMIPTPDNPRVIDTKSGDFADLLNSVKGVGVQMPVLVRRHPEKKGKWDLRAGARRLAAARVAKLKTIPAIVRDLTDAEAFEMTFIENFGREDLTPVEEGRAVETLLEKYNDDVSAVAAKLGRSEKWVRLRARLKNLSPDWQKRISDPERSCSTWGIGHMELLARFPQKQQTQILKVYKDTYTMRVKINLSVAALNKWIASTMLHRLSAAPFDTEDATLLKNAPACGACKKRSACQGMLFITDKDEEKRRKHDQCLDVVCWDAKVIAAAQAKLVALEKEHKTVLLVSDKSHVNYHENQRTKETYGRGTDLTKNGYKTARSKADQVKAVPALLVDGPHAGTTRFVIPNSSDSGSCSAGSTKGKPTPLKARRTTLEKKRWSETLKLLHDAVLEITADNLPNPNDLVLHVAKLAAIFGTRRRCTNPGKIMIWTGGEGRAAEVLKGQFCPWEKLERLLSLEVTISLWLDVRHVLLERITYNGPITQLPDEYVAEAKSLAELCGVDIDPLYAKACETYKEPKGWAGLKANGTRKTAKATATAGTTKGTKSTKDGKKRKAD